MNLINKHKALILEISALAIAIFLFALVSAYPVPKYRHDLTVLAFGDSLIRGYGTPPGKNFVTYLSEYINIPIINAGKTGDTTAEALIRLQSEVLDKKPDVVLILLGGNDYFNGFSKETTRVNLKVIIEKIKKINSKIILLGIDEKTIPDQEAVIKSLFEEEKVDGYVPSIMDGIFPNKKMLFDEIHPNNRSHEIIAKKILPTLEKVLKEF